MSDKTVTLSLAERLEDIAQDLTFMKGRNSIQAIARLAQEAGPVVERQEPALDIESAAKVLANCMDYPWEHMPENGRVLMRKHARDVIDAALTQPAESGASE